MAGAGLLADGKHLATRGREEASNFRDTYNAPVTVQVSSNTLVGTKQTLISRIYPIYLSSFSITNTHSILTIHPSYYIYLPIPSLLVLRDTTSPRSYQTDYQHTNKLTHATVPSAHSVSPH
jgi:hypothetical protein